MNFLLIPMSICGIFLNLYYLIDIEDKDRIEFTVEVLLAELIFILVIINEIPQTKTGFHC